MSSPIHSANISLILQKLVHQVSHQHCLVQGGKPGGQPICPPCLPLLEGLKVLALGLNLIFPKIMVSTSPSTKIITHFVPSKGWYFVIHNTPIIGMGGNSVNMGGNLGR